MGFESMQNAVPTEESEREDNVNKARAMAEMSDMNHIQANLEKQAGKVPRSAEFAEHQEIAAGLIYEMEHSGGVTLEGMREIQKTVKDLMEKYKEVY